MKKKLNFSIIAIIIAIIMAILYYWRPAIILLHNENKNQFKLNKDRYIVRKATISYSLKGDQKNYYEIDLKNNRVDLREDFIDFTDQKNNYSRKLISTKSLTKEENNRLREFLNKIMNTNAGEDKGDSKDTSSLGYWYSVTNKEAQDIAFFEAETIQEFEEIVKMDN